MTWTEWEKVADAALDFSEILYDKHYHKELEGGVARITVNRPKKYNAVTNRTVDEMFRAFYDASHDPMIGVIVLTGAGDHFGTGGDVEWERWGLREAFYNRYPQNRLTRMSRKPIIAMVRGYCIGGSNHMAYCCDFTIADETAIFAQAGPKVSSPADGFFVPYLTHVVGAKKAREMWMLCRRYTAQEAERMGLVNTVVPPDRLEAEVDRWCEEMLALSPGCLEILKATFDQEMDGYKEMGLIS
ncbi:MAG: enoyl-CoA hydratase/isomerase family protein, partial [Chloroflexi bacterium]|nr:enoyl-CoA hydratase/isomerase family protein [Chloroflexota bacterium]